MENKITKVKKVIDKLLNKGYNICSETQHCSNCTLKEFSLGSNCYFCTLLRDKYLKND